MSTPHHDPCPCGRPVEAGYYCTQHLEEFFIFGTVEDYAIVPRPPTDPAEVEDE